MNPLQKKCIIASAGLHGLLVLIIFVGPAFLSAPKSTADMPVLDFVPLKTVDALMSGGGNPKGGLPAPAPPAPQPPAAPAARPIESKPPPQPAPKAEPVLKPDPKPDPESFEVGKEPKHRIEVSTKLVKRRDEDSSNATAQAEAQARHSAERQAAAAAIGRAVAGIQSGLSGGTSIELKGPGGGGVPYANWMQAVKSVYDRAWTLPAGIKSDSATAAATVTIARDGRVVSAIISTRSGSSDVDDSVQTTLNRVRYTAPLPDDAREDQRTITIYFDVKAKLLG